MPGATEKGRLQAFLGLVLNFTPSWFAVNMGTGILGILIYNLPYQFSGQYYVAVAFYVLDAFLFTIFLLITLLRYYLYPWVFMKMVSSGQGLFVGTFPMGLATIVNLTVLIAVPYFGDWAVTLSWVLWWLDVVITVVCVLGMSSVMFEVHTNRLDQMTAAWLLPIVPAVVAAASGGVVAGVLQDQQSAVTTLVVSWILWGIGMGLSMMLLALYMQRLLLNRIPPTEVIVSAFLPVGPLGQGSFGIVQLGIVARNLLDDITATSGAGDIIYIVSVLMGLIIWGLGAFWLFHGVIAVIYRAAGGEIKFSMGFWGFIFPIGVYASGTIALGKALSSSFFSYLSAVFTVSLLLLWLYVATMTAYGAFTAKLFVAPCLSKTTTPEPVDPGTHA